MLQKYPKSPRKKTITADHRALHNWTVDWCWGLANCALSVAELRAGRPQAVWPGGLAAAGHGLLNTANMRSIT